MKLLTLFIPFTIGISIMVLCIPLSGAKSLTGPDALTAADAEAAPQVGIFSRMATSIFSGLKMAIMRLAQVASRSVKIVAETAGKEVVHQAKCISKDAAKEIIMDETKKKLKKYDVINQEREK